MKLVRYTGVSVVNVVVTQGLLVAFVSGVGLSGGVGNFLAVSGAAVPGYLLSRNFVWRRAGVTTTRSQLAEEVGIFWITTVAGLILSTVAAEWVDRRYGTQLAVSAANLASFGVLWVVKYLVLDQWVFHRRRVMRRHGPEGGPGAGL